MLRYVRVSGAFFGLIAAAQLVRTVRGWPVEVAGVTIPVWASGCAFVVAASFALWAFRSAKGAA